MSKISNMSIEEIFARVNIRFDLVDIPKICYRKEDAKRIHELILAGKNYVNTIIDNEHCIDKEKMLLVTWLSCKKDIDINRKELANTTILNTHINKSKIEKEIRDLNNNLIKIKKLCRDVDTYLVELKQENNLIKKIEVVSSKEEIIGLDFSEKEKNNRRIFDYIDQNLIPQQNENGMEYALQTIEYEDFEKVMPCDVAQGIIYKIRKNARVLGKDYIEKFEEKQQRGEVEDEEANKINDEYQQEVFLPELRSTIEQVLRHIDLKKLLLIEIYRLEKKLNESGGILSKEQLIMSEAITNFLITTIGKDVKIEDDDINYSYEDVQDFLSRINIQDGIYLTKEQSNLLRSELMQGLDIATVEKEKLNKICMLKYTQEELETIMNTSQTNFTFVMMLMKELSEDQILQKAHQYKDKWSDELTKHFYLKGELSIESIIQLYYDRIIRAEFIKEFSEDNDISSEINPDKIKELRSQIKQQKEHSQEDVQKLEAMVKLYKCVYFNPKNQDEKEEVYNEIIEIAEDKQEILFYYENGLLSLQMVADFCGESAIRDLYSQSEITFEDIEKLNMELEVKQELLGEIIILNAEEYDENTLLKYINLRYLSEDNIFKLYELGLIDKTNAEDMLNDGIISVPTYIKIYEIKTETLEEQAGSRLSDLVKMEKREFLLDILDDDEMGTSDLNIGDVPNSKERKLQEIQKDNKSKYNINNRTSESLIDPDIRWKFLKVLGCKIPGDEKINNTNQESPFYNYEFFVIEDNSDVAKRDSIIIAERFFKDKKTKDEFATSNATYIWSYVDYLTTIRKLNLEQKRNKRDALEEKDGAVYVANHRPGSWAISLLYKIAQAKAGESFKKYKKGNERATKVIEQLEKLYTHEQLMNIFDLAKIIDDEQVIETSEGKKIGIVYDVIKERKGTVVNLEDSKKASHNNNIEGR